jgi:hypothetical protein
VKAAHCASRDLIGVMNRDMIYPAAVDVEMLAQITPVK